MFGAGYFKGKVIAVMGAEHSLGTALSLRFSAFGATVVAIGEEQDALYALARRGSGSIEPLALRKGRRDVLGLLREAWGDVRLDIYIDTSPLCPSRQRQGAPGAFVNSAGVAAALMRGMRAGEARAALVFPQATPEAEASARNAGYRALVRQFGKACTPGRFCGLEIGGGAAWDQRSLTRMGDAAMMMVHPVSRAVQAGAVVPLEGMVSALPA